MFASTNVDDAFVLLAFFADSRIRPLHVAVGQYAGMAALVGGALILSLITLAIPSRYVGLLGILPIAIGIKHLREARRPEKSVAIPVAAHGAILSVATVTVANGGDNIAAYVPLFGRQSSVSILVICVIFALMTAIWCVGAFLMLAHPAVSAPIRRYGRPALPFVLMGIGVYILAKPYL
jgi:cadmium resistance protein CadD (predicted permease)